MPTPTVHGNNNYKGASAKAGDGLMTVIKRKEGLFPTPQARDCHSGTVHPHGWTKKGTGTQHNLNDFVLRWPTPCASGDLHYRLNGKSQASKSLAATVISTSSRTGLQLNPDWEEWYMAWPVGWTDIETPNVRLVWLDPSIDPADFGEIPRVTSRRDNRPARVKAIGNGQFPLAASVAFFWGRAVLAAMCKSKKGTTKCS
jgi:hypothetical protein